jgi:hypothetical protein
LTAQQHLSIMISEYQNSDSDTPNKPRKSCQRVK